MDDATNIQGSFICGELAAQGWGAGGFDAPALPGTPVFLTFPGITVPVRQNVMLIWEAPNHGKGFVPEGILVVEVEGYMKSEHG